MGTYEKNNKDIQYSFEEWKKVWKKNTSLTRKKNRILQCLQKKINYTKKNTEKKYV